MSNIDISNINILDIETPEDISKIPSTYLSEDFFPYMYDCYIEHKIGSAQSHDLVKNLCILSSDMKINNVLFDMSQLYVTEPSNYMRVDADCFNSMGFKGMILSFMYKMSKKQGRIDGVCYIRNVSYIYKYVYDKISLSDDCFDKQLLLLSEKNKVNMFKAAMKSLIDDDSIRFVYNSNGSRRYGYYCINYKKYRFVTLDSIYKDNIKRLYSNFISKGLNPCVDWAGYSDDKFKKLFGISNDDEDDGIKDPFVFIKEVIKHKIENNNGCTEIDLRYKDVSNVSQRTFKYIICKLIEQKYITRIGRAKFNVNKLD